MYFEQICDVYLIVRHSVGRGLALEDVARSKKMNFEQACDVYSIVRPSVGRGLRLEDVARGNKMHFEKTCNIYFFNCKAFGGPRDKTQRCISRQEDVF